MRGAGTVFSEEREGANVRELTDSLVCQETGISLAFRASQRGYSEKQMQQPVRTPSRLEEGELS